MNTKMRKRIVSLIVTLIFTMLGIVTGITASAAGDYSTGGWDQVQNDTNVVDANGGYVGKVYAGEGITIMYISGDKAWIEYSTSSIPKQGFVSIYNLAYLGGFTQTALGKITSSCSTYYSPSTTHYAGSVSTGEYVSVLCKTNNWSYIEYNVSGGKRKRAFIPTSSLTCYSSNIRNCFYHINTLGTRIYVPSRTTVYAGPDSNSYPSIGFVDPSDEIYGYWSFQDGSGKSMKYIKYSTSSGSKYGYIYA